MMSDGTNSLTVSPSSSDLASQHSHGKMVVSEPCHEEQKPYQSGPRYKFSRLEQKKYVSGDSTMCRQKRGSETFNDATCRLIITESHYLSFPELSSDLHSVQVPPWVGAPVVVTYPYFLNHVPDILQLGKEPQSDSAASGNVR